VSDEIRDERTHGLRDHLTPSQRARLLTLQRSDGWEVLLDLMEMCCIEQETKLINVEVKDESGIIAEHRMAKAFWQVFTSLQKKVAVEVQMHLMSEEEARLARLEQEGEDPEQTILRP
jgi:hypothetical protein